MSNEATVEQALREALAHHQAGQLAEAETLYRQVLAAQPRQPDALHLLGTLAHQIGRHDAAVELITQSLREVPGNPAALSNLGEAFRALGRLDEAVRCYEQALTLHPNFAEARHNLGSAQAAQGRLDAAQVSYEMAIARRPDYLDAHVNLGLLLKARELWPEARGCFERTLALQPGFVAVRFQIGLTYSAEGRPAEAVPYYEQVIAAQPDFVDAHYQLAVARKALGQFDAAVASFREAARLQPDNALLQSALISALQLHPDADPEFVRQEQRAWCERFAEPVRASLPAHKNDRTDPDRRLRIGYVSADLRQGPACHFLVPLLEAHDREQVAVCCYSSAPRADAVTARLQKSAEVWRDVGAFPHDALAVCIQADQIDILVDLAGHEDGNRLPVFAHRPAPVQVSWLPDGGEAGLDAIDYALSDGWCCYDPLGETPPVGDLPALLRNGGVTFGALGDFGQVSDAVLSLWARVLEAVPDSRLLLSCPEGEPQQRVLAFFAQREIPAHRVNFVSRLSRREALQTYNRLDIALDPFPFHGATTACDALWMGVPVLTLGSRFVSAVGLEDWIAADQDDFLRRAVESSEDLTRLTDLRAGLRERMKASPLMDAAGCARRVEAAYRAMWRQWCEQPETTAVPAGPASTAEPGPSTAPPGPV